MGSAFGHEELRVYQAAIEFVAWHDEGAAKIARKVSAWRKNGVPGKHTPYSYTYSYTRNSSHTDDGRDSQ